MVDIAVENERIQRLHWQQMGEDWIRTITSGRIERLGQYCLPGVISHLLTDSRFVTLNTVTDLIAKFQAWFGKCADFQIESQRVGLIGERLGIFYRFKLSELGTWYLVEQQLFASLVDDRIQTLHLLCSGFQPTSNDAAQLPTSDDLLEINTVTTKNESTCAVLTPAIKARLNAMLSGQVLEVRVDDPAARMDIEAWCRLSGNQLLHIIEEKNARLRFFVRKK